MHLNTLSTGICYQIRLYKIIFDPFHPHTFTTTSFWVEMIQDQLRQFPLAVALLWTKKKEFGGCGTLSG